MSALIELLNYFLPTNCCLCQKIGGALCDSCQVNFKIKPRQTSRENLIGFSLCDYSDEAITLIHSFKEGGESALSKSLGALLAQSFATELANANLIPIPSARTSSIKRGFQPAQQLALALASSARLKLNRLPLVQSCLTFNREVLDQAALSSSARAKNLSGAMSSIKPVGTCWLVDDVVTTGATVLEAARAVRAAGGQVAGFITFAESVRKRPPNSNFGYTVHTPAY